MTVYLAPPRRRPRLKWTLTAIVLLAWAGMTASLVRREILPRHFLGARADIDPATLRANWRDIDECMELFYQGVSLGFIRSEARRLDSGDILAALRLRLRLPLGPLTAPARADGLARLDSRLALRTASLDAEIARLPRLRVEALALGAELRGLARVGQRTQSYVTTLDRPPSFLQSSGPLLARRYDLAVGQSFALPAFDPLWRFGQGDATIRVTARETITPRPDRPGWQVEAFRLETLFADQRIVSWIDDEGRTLRQEFGRDLAFVQADLADAVARFADLGQPSAPPIVDEAALLALPAAGQAGAPEGSGADVKPAAEFDAGLMDSLTRALGGA